MNKNLLLWAIIIVVVALTYVGIFFLGRGSVKPVQGSIEVKEVIKYDTVQTIRKIFINRYVQVETKRDSIKSYSDSISGDTLETKYDILHTVLDSFKTIHSLWKVHIEPRFRTITKTVTKDSIQTKINNVYLTKPFFLDTYFWSTVTLFVITVLMIIF